MRARLEKTRKGCVALLLSFLIGGYTLPADVDGDRAYAALSVGLPPARDDSGSAKKNHAKLLRQDFSIAEPDHLPGQKSFVGTWKLKGTLDGRSVDVRLTVRETPKGKVELHRLCHFRDRADPAVLEWHSTNTRWVDAYLLARFRRKDGSPIQVYYRLDGNDPRKLLERSWPTMTVRSQGKRSLDGLFGTGQSTRSWRRVLDQDAIERFRAAPTDPVLTRIAIARSLIWHDLINRTDSTGFVPESGGEWRVNTIEHPDGHTYQVVHWCDIDDNSWTVYFEGGKVYEVFYEN